MKKTLGKAEKTLLGLRRVEFKDGNNAKCSLQESSCVRPTAIWLGVTDADPKIMARYAADFGIQTKETTGWISYPVPKAVLLRTRMHLDRKQVVALVHHLQKWLKSGKI